MTQKNAIQKADKPKTLQDWIKTDSFKDQIQMALPKHMSPDRYLRVLLTMVNKNKKLQQCDQSTVFQAMLDCSSVGLEPDGRRAHLIPYGKTCTLIIDYKGLIELSKRSGEVATWRADIVRDNDEFTYINGVVRHEINFKKDRGEAYAVFSHVHRKDGVDEYEVMTIDDVQKIRKRSKQPNGQAWTNDFDEMAKKTVMRRHSKKLTLSPEFNTAVEVMDKNEGIILDANYQDLSEHEVIKAEEVKMTVEQESDLVDRCLTGLEKLGIEAKEEYLKVFEGSEEDLLNFLHGVVKKDIEIEVLYEEFSQRKAERESQE